MERDARRIDKVVIAGPVGVGKSTAVRAASDVPVLETEARPSDDTRAMKASTTVALDFGVTRLDDTRAVHVYGTPGQKRFDFMWDILVGGSAGVMLLVDGSDPDASDGLDPYLDAFAPMLARRRFALGVTRLRPDAVEEGLARCRARLGDAGAEVPVLETDPRSRFDVLVLIRALLATSDRHATPGPPPGTAAAARPIPDGQR